MVKHVKLFENWAEEDAKLPEWLDPDVQYIKHGKWKHASLYYPTILKKNSR